MQSSKKKVTQFYDHNRQIKLLMIMCESNQIKVSQLVFVYNAAAAT